MLADASMIAPGPSREPTPPDAVESYGTGRMTTRAGLYLLCSAVSAAKFRGGKKRSSVMPLAFYAADLPDDTIHIHFFPLRNGNSARTSLLCRRPQKSKRKP